MCFSQSRHGLTGVGVGALPVGIVGSPDQPEGSGQGDVVHARDVVLESGMDLTSQVVARQLGYARG